MSAEGAGFWDEILRWAWLAATGLLAFFGRRELKRHDEERRAILASQEKLEERLRNVEKAHVTRDDFDELRSSMMASFTNMAERIEDRMGKMHDENRDSLRENRETLRDIHARVDDIYRSTSGNQR